MLENYIDEHGKRLYGLCLALCKNVPDASDLYQETWLRVLQKINQYDKTKPFEPYLTKICVNAFRDFLRKQKRSVEQIDFKSDREKNVIFENIAQNEKSDYSSLYHAIQNLPQKLRSAVILFYFFDKSEKETAQSLGVPLGTVKSRLNKAKKLLRKELENEQQSL